MLFYFVVEREEGPSSSTSKDDCHKKRKIMGELQPSTSKAAVSLERCFDRERKDEPRPSTSKDAIILEKMDKENRDCLTVENVNRAYKPRPVEHMASVNEVVNFVRFYKERKKIPSCPENVCHAERYWIIAILHRDAEEKFNLLDFCRKFDMNPRMFSDKGESISIPGNNHPDRQNCVIEITELLKKYRYLSPGEFKPNYRRRIIKEYGSADAYELYSEQVLLKKSNAKKEKEENRKKREERKRKE